MDGEEVLVPVPYVVPTEEEFLKLRNKLFGKKKDPELPKSNEAVFEQIIQEGKRQKVNQFN